MTGSALFGVIGGEVPQERSQDLELSQHEVVSRERFRLELDSGVGMSENGMNCGMTIKTPTSVVEDGEWAQVDVSEVS